MGLARGSLASSSSRTANGGKRATGEADRNTRGNNPRSGYGLATTEAGKQMQPGGRAGRAGIAARIACAKRFGCPDGMEKSIECALKRVQAQRW